MRIDIVGLKDALARNVGVWDAKAEEAERLAARLEAFDPASLGLEGEGYSALRERITSHAPFAKSQASLLRSLSEGCARNLDAATLLEPSEPDGSVDTDHLADELSHARGGAEEWGERSDDLSWAGPLNEPWRRVCDSMRQLKEAEAAEYERKIRLVEEYAAKSSTFYVGTPLSADEVRKGAGPITQDFPQGEDSDQAELYRLWANAQDTLRYSKDEEKRKQAQATLDWIRNLVRKYHPEWDWDSDQIDKKIENFLWKLNDEGCSYAADINALMQQYSITDLRQRFGIPDDVPDSQVKDWLLLDYYASQDNHNPSHWPWSWEEDTYDEHEDPKETDGRGMNFFDERYRLHRWLEGHGINASVSLPRPVNILGGMDAMKDDLCKGKHVILSMTDHTKLHNEDGSVYQESDGGHAVTVIGIDAQGRIIVSSWGQRLYVWPSDFGPFDLMYEIVDYE